MCRIAGVWDLEHRTSMNVMNLAEEMVQTMAHGGPDGKGSYTDESSFVALGHRRLAVIDLSEAGAQPMQRENLVITFNGEIYNYKALREELEKEGFLFSSMSDTEVILYAYKAWGVDCFSRFSGMFALAIWDEEMKKMILARDRMGVKPLYWYLQDGMLLFASELKAFHSFSGFQSVIDQDAVSLYLQKGYIQAPFSIFKHVRKLEPATVAIIGDSAEIEFQKYWEWEKPTIHQEMANENKLAQQAVNILKKGFFQRMVADVPVGVFLSGGIDSTLVTALVSSGNPELMTFTMGFEQEDFNEAPLAKKLADIFKTRHHEFVCTQNDLEDILPVLPEIFDEPFGDSSGIPTYLLARQARKEVKVVLSADGGDEIFGGYLRFRLAYDFQKKYRLIPRIVRIILANGISLFWQSGLYSVIISGLARKKPLPSASRVRKLIAFLRSGTMWDALNAMSSLGDKKTITSLHKAPFFLQKNESTDPKAKGDLLSAMGRHEMKSYLEGDILVKVDRATMFVGLEAREPFLDNDIVAFGLSLSDNLKIRNGTEKWLLRNILSSLVPKYFTELPKKGFGVPIDFWLRNRFHSELKDMCTDKNFCDTFSLHQEYLKRTIQKYLASRFSLIDPHFIWAMYSLYLWYKRWYANYSPALAT